MLSALYILSPKSKQEQAQLTVLLKNGSRCNYLTEDFSINRVFDKSTMTLLPSQFCLTGCYSSVTIMFVMKIGRNVADSTL